jgi:uncharacterized cupredoxin-like copper-binding protein
MRTKSLTAALLASSLLVVTACGGDGETADAPAEAAAATSGGVTVVATEFAFDPADLSLPADQATDLTLDNQGVVEHDIVVEELEDRELVYADPGQSVTASVTVPAGTYTFYCSIPGHREAGMEGTLTVG